MGIFKKFFDKLKYTFKRTELDEDFYDELESILVTSDMGVETALGIIDELRVVCKQKLIKDIDSAQKELKTLLINKLEVKKVEFEYPLIITVVGVNGVGKTTTIAKMTKFFTKNKKSVLLAAGDTFRAAATEQLNTWAEKLKVKIVKQGEGADSASVVFDAISSMKAKNNDVLIVDTAGRLHTKTNLMS